MARSIEKYLKWDHKRGEGKGYEIVTDYIKEHHSKQVSALAIVSASAARRDNPAVKK